MSHKHQATEGFGDAEEELNADPGPPRNRQANGSSAESATRRSWRPCQMLNEDGEPIHHHHHPPHQHHPPPHQHHPAASARGPPRQRRRPPPGPGQTQGQSHGQGQVSGPTVPDVEPQPTPHPRPGVARYRRMGDPNPRLRAHRQRQPSSEVSSTPTPLQQHPAPYSDQRESPSGPAQQEVIDRDGHSVAGPSSYVHDNTQAFEDWREDQCGERVLEGEEEEEREEVQRGCVEENFAQESETNDLCSDTESAASLSMEGHLHSPPPLHSPTPPSSPEISSFPHLDQYHEDAGLSPDTLHNDALPENDDDCSVAHSVSYTYPKTYADFYSESHSKSCPQPLSETYSEPYTKSYPDSFPEPLMTPYPELGREPHRRSGRRCESWEDEEESYQEPSSKHRSQEHVQEGAPTSSPTGQGSPAPRLSRDLSSFQTQTCQSRSVGSRLHHYDGQSDGEGDSTDGSISSKSLAAEPRQAQGEAQEKGATTGQSRLGEARLDEQARVGVPGEDAGKGSGDAISLAIKDIKEAIEEVKTKTVRSPYTPDQPIEPIWVMRQDVSPTEDGYQPTVGSHGGVSTRPIIYLECSMSQSPDHYGSALVRDPGSPVGAESSRVQQQHYHPHHPQSLHHPAHPPQQRDLPGPCDPEDLIDGIIFAASYLGSTHLLSERTPSKSARMQQAQEAMHRVRSAEAEAPSTAEVDLFMSTQRIKVLNADTQEAMMDLPLRTISYIADIGNMVVLMARGKMVRSRSATQEPLEQSSEQETLSNDDRRLYRMICHVFESEDAQLIAQSIGQSFSVAYQEFLRANGIDPEDLSQREYSDLLNTQDMYNDDLIHFSKSENCKDVYIEKQKGEMLGVVIVESGWGSILPTVIIASMMHAGPAEKSGRLNIGDQIMTINGTSLVGLPLNTCQSIIKGLKSQSRIKMNIVRCPPVTMVLIRRPDLRYQLGFSVQNGIICSLMRGGIAERGGVRVGHRIIEINSQSVVATPHEKIVQILSNAMGEIHMKTMPAAMYRLLTAQEQPVYI
ncbi:unnamed protein product [Merluccius merluccius]